MRVQFPVLRPHQVWAPALHVIKLFFQNHILCCFVETSHGAFYFALLKSTMKPKNERFWWLLNCTEAISMILKSSQD